MKYVIVLMSSFYVLREASPDYIPLSIVTSRYELLRAIHHHYKESGPGFLIDLFYNGELTETLEQDASIPPLEKVNLLKNGAFINLDGHLYKYIEGNYELTVKRQVG